MRKSQKKQKPKKGMEECPSSLEPISARGFSLVCATHLAPFHRTFFPVLIPLLSSAFALVSSNI
jgi:hypothetical protein